MELEEGTMHNAYCWDPRNYFIKIIPHAYLILFKVYVCLHSVFYISVFLCFLVVLLLISKCAQGRVPQNTANYSLFVDKRLATAPGPPHPPWQTSQPSECEQQHNLISVHAQTAAWQQSNGNSEARMSEKCGEWRD